MENDWVKIYVTADPVRAHMIIDMLRDKDIDAVEMNKRDSSYTVFGSIEIYCRPTQVIQAKEIINRLHEK